MTDKPIKLKPVLVETNREEFEEVLKKNELAEEIYSYGLDDFKDWGGLVRSVTLKPNSQVFGRNYKDETYAAIATLQLSHDRKVSFGYEKERELYLIFQFPRRKMKDHIDDHILISCGFSMYWDNNSRKELGLVNNLCGFHNFYNRIYVRPDTTASMHLHGEKHRIEEYLAKGILGTWYSDELLRILCRYKNLYLKSKSKKN